MSHLNKPLVLGSSSPARRELLTRLGMPFEVCSPDIDESPLPNESAPALVERLSIAKAQTCARSFPHALIIGADQVGVFDNTILGKPLTQAAAIKQLHQVSGQTVRFYTGICLLDASSQQYHTRTGIYDVTFRQLTQDMIENYLRLENALQCAGSFHVEGLGIVLLQRMQGEDYTSLIGLPMIALVDLLNQFGVHVV